MGTNDSKKTWLSIFVVARTNGKDFDSAISSRGKQSKHLSDSNKEKSDTWVGGYFDIMESQDKVSSRKLLKHTQD